MSVRPMLFAAATAAWLLMAATAQAQASGGGGAGAQRDNRADHDRWSRSSPASTKASSDDSASSDDDGDHDQHDAHNATVTNRAHKGELNGKLHMGEWS